MWHLIIPPIVVVACFVLILWYLSLRGTDPEVAKRALAIGDDHEGRVRAALRGFSLRVLEKLAQRFKVMSLRVHNAFHDFLQSVKEKRKLSDSRMIASAEEYEPTLPVDEGNDSAESDDVQPSKPVMDGASSLLRPANIPEAATVSAEAPLVPTFSLTTPLRRKRRDEAGGDISVSADASVERVVRPMVSDRAAEPERPKRKFIPKPIEEDLIARIAVNPKDYTAYEALGDFYMERGSIQDAKECYRQVLKLSPVQRMVKIKIRRLERLLSQK